MIKKVLAFILLAFSTLSVPTQLVADAPTRGGCCPTKNECNACECEVSSHSFFSCRPLYQTGSPEYLSQAYDRREARKCGRNTSFEAVPFGSKSTKAERLATFFTPFCKTHLVVKESPDQDTDIDARQFNIRTENGNFESVISFAPSRTEAGVGLAWRQGFARSIHGRGFWFSVSGPITRVETSMNLCEQIADVETGGPLEDTAPDMTAAFKQKSWKYGRIDACSCNNEITRIADITIQLGYDVTEKETYHIESHVGLVLPTGNKVTSITLFEPIVGFEKHAGLQFGNSVELRVWNNDTCKRNLWLNYHFQTLYLFQNSQFRLVDVKGKPWSRFMETYRNQSEAEAAANATTDNDKLLLYTPGANELNIPVKVSHGFQRIINTALIYNDKGFEGELGYNFFCRPAECVKLDCDCSCPFKENFAFKDITYGRGSTNSGANISGVVDGTNKLTDTPGLGTLPVDEYNDNIIRVADLDFDSAAHPCMITHTFYSALGYRWDDREFPLSASVGGSYELGVDNTSMSRWVAWAKFGVSL